MIDGWGVFHNGLWVVGLAVALAAMSAAHYRAGREGRRLRDVLSEAGFQRATSLALALFCLGLLCSSRAGWEQAVWGGLAAASTGQALWLWGQEWSGRRATPGAANRAARKARWLGWGLLLAGMVVVAASAALTAAQVLEHTRPLQAHLDQVDALAENLGRAMDVADLERAGAALAGMGLAAGLFLVAAGIGVLALRGRSR